MSYDENRISDLIDGGLNKKKELELQQQLQEENKKLKKENIAKAIIQVMKEVKGMEKKAKVGSGNMAYSGVKDQDVKEVFNEAMAKNGLCILPIYIEEETNVERWIEEGGQYGPKRKQSVFTKVKTKYLLLHESGQSIELSGFGHGVDTQDKSAGKATTYALKNCLLYTFLTPVGKIDDTDATHSNDHSTPPGKTEPPKTPTEPPKTPKPTKWLKPNTVDWQNALEKKKSLEFVKKYYKIRKEDEEAYKKAYESLIKK